MMTVVAPSRNRIAVASFIGTAIEFYDFYIYGTAAALVFGKLFFPSFSAAAGTLLSLATFAVGFIARPLGAVLFGHFGDRLGRKRVFMTGLAAFGVLSALCAVAPTAELLIVARAADADAFGLGRVDNLLTVFAADCQRLLVVNALAGVDRRHGDFSVAVRRGNV